MNLSTQYLITISALLTGFFLGLFFGSHFTTLDQNYSWYFLILSVFPGVYLILKALPLQKRARRIKIKVE